MATTIIHFGEDTCFRLPVLRSAGYTVEECESLDVFAGLLNGNTDAVMLEEEPEISAPRVVTLIRARSSAPIILFRNGGIQSASDGFDLIIPALTAPEDWLRQIADLLEQSRAVRAESMALTQTAAALRQESAAVREAAGRIRERSIAQRSASIHDPWKLPGSAHDPTAD